MYVDSDRVVNINGKMLSLEVGTGFEGYCRKIHFLCMQSITKIVWMSKSINILFNKFAEPYKKKKKSLLIAIYSRHIYIRFINSVADKNQWILHFSAELVHKKYERIFYYFSIISIMNHTHQLSYTICYKNRRFIV